MPPMKLILALLFASYVSCVEESSQEWTGLYINGRQYPSVEEIQNMSVAELVKLRPTECRYLEKDNFQLLFSQLPDVRKLHPNSLSEEEFIDGWVELWISAGLGPDCKKLHSAIFNHLQALGVSENIKTKIRFRHDFINDTIKGQKYREKKRQSADPVEVVKRERKLQLHAQYAKERRKGIRGIQVGSDKFEAMLKSEGVATELPAEELEKATRHLRDIVGGVQTTSMNLRYYLLCRDKKENGIEEAMLARRLYNHKILRKAVNAKQKERDRARRVRERSSRIDSAEAVNHSNTASSSAKLIRQCAWWTA